MKRLILFLFAHSMFACTSQTALHAPRMTLADTDRRDHTLPASGGDVRYTVLVFRSQKCACVSAHTGRLRDLSQRFTPRGVRFYAVNPEPGVEFAAERASSAELGFPVLFDRQARLAESLGASYAGYTVVLDEAGQVLYRGGIDSDQKKLHADAEPYLSNALDDLLAGRPVRRPESHTLGCALRTW